MSDELRPINNPALPASGSSYKIDVQGDDNQIVAHVERVEQTIKVFLSEGRGRSGRRNGRLCALNPSHYQLFVIDGESYQDDVGTFTVQKELALTKCISDELKRKYARLTDDMIEEIKTFPAVFASLNRDFGCTETDHMASYGVVTKVEKLANVIEISYHILEDIPQQSLNELASFIGLAGVPKYNELNDPHWTIKPVNLIEALKTVGIEVVTIT